MSRFREVVRLFGIELGQAIRSPSFWLSMLTRTLVLFLGLSILFKWAYRAENWTFNRAAEMVFTNWSFYLLAVGLGAVGRAVDDRNLSISEIARVLTHRTLTLSRPLDLFAVIGLFLAGVGEQSYATLIALICGAIHVNRIIGCDASNELKSLPHREKKRGFATYEGDFPPRTR